MALVHLCLVKFYSTDPEDRLVKWLVDLNFWNTMVKYRVEAAKGFLPLDVESDLKDKLELPLDRYTKKVFSNLVASDVGISLKTLGYCDHGWKDPETCVGKILGLQLGRVQDEKRFKALSCAFDPRVQYLVGVRSRPY